MNEPLSYAAARAPAAAGLAPPSPLSTEQITAIAAARAKLRPILRAAAVARFDWWSLVAFGGLTLAFDFQSMTGLLIGSALVAVAMVERAYVPRMLALDPLAPRTLAFNQLALAAALILYSLWNLAFPGNLTQQLAGASGADLDGLGIDLSGLAHMLNTLVYGALIAIAVLAQGSMAWFYFRRVQMINRFCADTPAWVIEMIRANAA